MKHNMSKLKVNKFHFQKRSFFGYSYLNFFKNLLKNLVFYQFFHLRYSKNYFSHIRIMRTII